MNVGVIALYNDYYEFHHNDVHHHYVQYNDVHHLHHHLILVCIIGTSLAERAPHCSYNLSWGAFVAPMLPKIRTHLFYQ